MMDVMDCCQGLTDRHNDTNAHHQIETHHSEEHTVEYKANGGGKSHLDVNDLTDASRTKVR